MIDPQSTIISQYSAAQTITALIESMNEWLDPRANIDAWYSQVWNILTAVGYGLDVWGRILVFPRVIQVPSGKYFGFEEGGTADYDTFNAAPFYSGTIATDNVSLGDTQYRLALLAKAAANISNCSIPAINAILLALFPLRGDCHVTDGEDMTGTYTFTFPLTPVELGVVSQPNLLPRPDGVQMTVVHP